MNERYESIRKSINEDIEACDSLISRLNTASSAKDKSLKTDQEIFINFLESEKAVLEASRLLKEVDQEEVQLLFKQDPDITVFLTSKQLLGYFEVTPDNTGTVVSTKTFGVKTADDQKNCDVTGLCQFVNGYVMIDSRNQKVKKLNNIFQVVAEHLLPQYPYNVCTISEKEIAVTVCDWSNKKEIRFLSETKGKFEVKKVIPLKHDCSGLAIVNGQLYVGSPEGIFVYKTTGEKVKQLSTIKVQNFALTLDNSRIIVPDKDKNVFVTIDQKTGNEITKCGIKDMKGPTDVCFAGSGTAFVCDNMSNNIVLVDKSVTRSLKTVARDTDGVCKPNCLYYNEKTAELLVGQDWDKIVVLQMKRA